MTNQKQLAERFANGATDGQASNMEIEGDRLIGYGWAVYGERLKNGTLVLYNGWNGYSQSTNCQLSKIKPYFDEVSQEAPSANTERVMEE